MARDLNKAQLTGRLGADPEMRYLSDGTAITTFRVASNRQWRDSSGAQHTDAEWFRVVAWDKLGEICNQYLIKGSRVYIEGRLQTRKWTDRDGQERYTTEVVASDMIILSQAGGRDAPPDEVPPADDEEEPLFGDPMTSQRASTQEPPKKSLAKPRGTFVGRNQPQPISDEDAPF